MTDPYSSAYLNRPTRPHSTPSPELSAGHQVTKSIQKKVGSATGTGRGKGSVRAKSGCYTCRIRRKKCDEQRDQNDNCQTCVRLRLECLGFGQKRPDWMRENNSVPDLREKIKQFLASQGMIKGHSGSGSRNVDSSQPGPILKLSDVTPPTKGHSITPSGGQQAANNSSGPRSAGSSAASSPQSPRSPLPPSTLYHPPPPTQSHYSPPHGHSQHADPQRYPHIVTSYARDPPRTGSDMMPYSPISPDLPTPATASTNGPVGHPHGGHGHGHGHGDPYNAAHSPGTPSYRLPLDDAPDVTSSSVSSSQFHPNSRILPPPPSTTFLSNFRSPPITQFPGITSAPRPPRGTAYGAFSPVY